jgi:hypothetical protein
MKKALKFLSRVLLGLLIAALIVPFLIPVETSGTKTYQEAAGAQATFAKAEGIDVYIDVTEFEEYTDLQQDLENWKNGYHEVLANKDELIKENAILKAELAKVNRSVFGRLFSK